MTVVETERLGLWLVQTRAADLGLPWQTENLFFSSEEHAEDYRGTLAAADSRIVELVGVRR